MFYLVQVLVPIFICVVLPVSIVFIVFNSLKNSDNRRAQVLIKAIESGNNIDTDKLTEAMRKPQKSPVELLNLRLLRGCIFSLIGLVFIISAICLLSMTDCDLEEEAFTLMIPGGISLAIGIGYMIVYFVSRKQIKTDCGKK